MEYGLHKLIRNRREKKGIARTKFAHIVGISPSSMVKYELPEDEGGKIPSSINLMKICELLEIDPRIAFDAIQHGLAEKEAKANPKIWEAPPKGVHPNDLPKAFSFLYHFKSDEEWINDSTQFKSIQDFNNAAENFFVEFHFIQERLDKIQKAVCGTYPGEENHKKWEERRAHMAESLKEENGPDQNDPSRSEKSTINSEAVGAVSTKQSKGKSDDVA